MLRVGFVLLDGFHVITFAAMAVFEVANKTLDEPRYDLRLLSEMGGLIRSSVGALVQTEPFGVERFDTLIVAGAGKTFEPSLGMLDFVRKAPEVARRVASSCIGAFTLAEAGILDGRRATTHWQHASRLQKRFPKVNVEEDRIFTEDRGVWTSAGMTASIDLMLALAENDVGIEVSRVVARKLVLHRRAGGQSGGRFCVRLANLRSPSAAGSVPKWRFGRRIPRGCSACEDTTPIASRRSVAQRVAEMAFGL